MRATDYNDKLAKKSVNYGQSLGNSLWGMPGMSRAPFLFQYRREKFLFILDSSISPQRERNDAFASRAKKI